MAGEKIYIADKETLDKVYNILASDPVYGFIEHNDILSPFARIEYIGLNKNYSPLVRNKETGGMALNSWADFPVIKANKPYMVRADGTPDYRLKETDYTQREDGGSSDVANSSYNGGAFSWLMKIYKIFHSIVLGSYQQWMRDPYEVVVNGRVKVSKNYTYDPTGAKYTDTGIVVPDNKTWDTNHNALDYPAHFRTVPGYGSIPALGMDGGSSATGGCDGLWRKDPKQTFTGVCLRFGSCNHGLYCGLRARHWSSSATPAYWDFGAADLLLPPVGVAV